MRGNIILGQGLEERAAVGPELLVGESLLDRGDVVPGSLCVSELTVVVVIGGVCGAGEEAEPLEG